MRYKSFKTWLSNHKPTMEFIRTAGVVIVVCINILNVVILLHIVA